MTAIGVLSATEALAEPYKIDYKKDCYAGATAGQYRPNAGGDKIKFVGTGAISFGCKLVNIGNFVTLGAEAELQGVQGFKILGFDGTRTVRAEAEPGLRMFVGPTLQVDVAKFDTALTGPVKIFGTFGVQVGIRSHRDIQKLPNGQIKEVQRFHEGAWLGGAGIEFEKSGLNISVIYKKDDYLAGGGGVWPSRDVTGNQILFRSSSPFNLLSR